VNDLIELLFCPQHGCLRLLIIGMPLGVMVGAVLRFGLRVKDWWLRQIDEWMHRLWYPEETRIDEIRRRISKAR